MSSVFDALYVGLEDYTVNERGDVGSWVRIACIKSLCQIIEALISETNVKEVREYSSWTTNYEIFSRYLTSETYHKAIGAILKQGVERLDNVRQCVGGLFRGLLILEPPKFSGGKEWVVRNRKRFEELFFSNDIRNWSDGAWLYPKATRLLDVKEYRIPVMRGFLMSIASKTSSTVSI